MSEAYNPLGERIIHIDFIKSSSTKPKETITFSTDGFDIYSPRALTVEGTIYKSLEVYYSIQPIGTNESYTAIPNQSLESAFYFLSKLELYHLQVGDAPWIDATFYFRPWFSIHTSPITKLNLSDINEGRTHLIAELSFMDGELKFCTETKSGKNKEVLISSGRYAIEPDHVYSALRKYARVTATPKSITNTIIKNL